jgi:hypothetical protein
VIFVYAGIVLLKDKAWIAARQWIIEEGQRPYILVVNHQLEKREKVHLK